MNPPSEPVTKWLALVSTLAQILAIGIAGVWTYQKFMKTEAPSLELHPDVSSDLTWGRTHQADQCKANFIVYVANKGRTSFTVEKVEIRAWEIAAPGKVSKPWFWDVEKVKAQGNYFFDEEFREGRLSGHYPPGFSRHTAFSWPAVPRADSGLILFSAAVALRDSKGNVVTPPPFTDYWDETCGGGYSDR